MVNRHVMHARQGMAVGGVIGGLMETVHTFCYHLAIVAMSFLFKMFVCCCFSSLVNYIFLSFTREKKI